MMCHEHIFILCKMFLLVKNCRYENGKALKAYQLFNVVQFMLEQIVHKIRTVTLCCLLEGLLRKHAMSGGLAVCILG